VLDLVLDHYIGHNNWCIYSLWLGHLNYWLFCMCHGEYGYQNWILMRTSQYWTHTCHGLPQVTSRLQLGHRVWFGFSRHPCTVSALSPSYDIKTRCSSMCWKGDDHAVILVLVLDPEHLWIMLCGHDKVLHHLFGLNGPCIMSGLKPKLWVTPHGLPQP